KMDKSQSQEKKLWNAAALVGSAGILGIAAGSFKLLITIRASVGMKVSIALVTLTA
ncbi:ATP synthase epsilon chain, partial [Clarias magur]